MSFNLTTLSNEGLQKMYISKMAQLGDARARQVLRIGGNLMANTRSNRSGIADIVDRAWDSLDSVKAEIGRRRLSLPNYDIAPMRSVARQRKSNSNAAVAGLTGGVELRLPIDTNAPSRATYRAREKGEGGGAEINGPKEPSTLAKVCSGLTCGLSNYIFGSTKTEGGRRRTKKNKKSRRSRKM
jgi:hypothetical protein